MYIFTLQITEVETIKMADYGFMARGQSSWPCAWGMV